MRYLLSFIVFLSCVSSHAQIDTLTVEDEPVVITEQVFFAAPVVPLLTKIEFDLGYPYAKGFYETGNTSGDIFTELKYGVEKKGFNIAGGLGYARFKYQESSLVTVIDEIPETYTISDTSYSYTLSEDLYPGSNYYDTTWFITIENTDTTIINTVESEKEIETTTRSSYLYIPISLGYFFELKKIRLGGNIDFAPLFYSRNDKINIDLLYGFSGFMQYSLANSISIGFKSSIRKTQKRGNNSSLPNNVLGFSLFTTFNLN